MFSGIVQYRGRVLSLERDRGGATLRVRCEGVRDEGPSAKDSVAIDGVCLTVTKVNHYDMRFDVVPETLARTTLGARKPGETVNVEFALRLGDRIGGHFVQGHVDGVARVMEIVDEGQGKRMRLERPASVASGIVEKGFVALDGVSLTVAAVGDGWFDVALVPETLTRTTFGARGPGDRVNVEIDPAARYARAEAG